MAIWQVQERHKGYHRLQERADACYQQRGSELDELSATLAAQPCTVAEGSLKALEAAFAAWRKRQTERDQVLQRMLQAGVLCDGCFAELAYKTDFKREEFDACYAVLQNLYANLESEQRNFDNRLAAHTKDALIRVRELEDAAKQIRDFKDEINQEFCRHRISDLEEIRVSFRLHPNF